MDEQLFRQQMLAAYHELAPEAGSAGDYLIERLSKTLFNRGARMEIGHEPPLEKRTIHHSFDPDQRLVWVCKLWNQTMGYRSRAAIGRHISDILAPHSYAQFVSEGWWEQLMNHGHYGPVEITLVTAHGQQLQAKGKSERMRDSTGMFVRTFAKLIVMLPAALFAGLIAFLHERDPISFVGMVL